MHVRALPMSIADGFNFYMGKLLGKLAVVGLILGLLFIWLLICAGADYYNNLQRRKKK